MCDEHTWDLMITWRVDWQKTVFYTTHIFTSSFALRGFSTSYSLSTSYIYTRNTSHPSNITTTTSCKFSYFGLFSVLVFIVLLVIIFNVPCTIICLTAKPPIEMSHKSAILAGQLIKYSALCYCGAYCVSEYIFDFTLCTGPSMLPTIQERDIVLTEHISTRFFFNIKRGDIVIFKSPSDPKQFLCKRVQGLESDEIPEETSWKFLKTTKYVWPWSSMGWLER
ncbi:uncharacterized protein LOC121420973 isoform X2 [Lytechinus variegatus]|uniref:uncharacterized protein LOC121420973 isoform X2 n=1 Tax=Lytechinus variegatus TaxID=7654 RepID=UPI001BB25E10|nr:uncharacterized protein LOC121420973 isoform X2 [Lytechinus variegatus]